MCPIGLLVSTLVLLLTNFCYGDVTDLCGNCLVLSPQPEARKLAAVDPDYFLGLESYSGFFPVKKQHESHQFFWFFPSPGKPLNDTPWVVWLNGGPGFSSLFALFESIGPIQYKKGKLYPRKVTWLSDYSLLFIDNPVGAGFSFTAADNNIPDNIHDVGDQLYNLLQQFLEVFPELRTAPLFLAGQSYAGKYVPALGHHIHIRRTSGKPINLKGLSIGNGMIDLRSSMDYDEFCRETGLMDGKGLEHLTKLKQKFVQFLDENKMVDASNVFNHTIEYIKKESGVGIYNYEKDPAPHSVPFEEFVNSPEIRKAIHVGNATYYPNNQVVYERMLPDVANSTKPYIEELLEHYPVMCYSGQLDVILPYSLSKRTYSQLQWSRKSEYNKASRSRLLNPQGNVVSYERAGGNFVEVLIRHAGHSVPADQPVVMKFIIDRFINKAKDHDSARGPVGDTEKSLSEGASDTMNNNNCSLV